MKPVSPFLARFVIPPLAFLFGLSLLVSLSGMEIFSTLIIVVVLFHIHWSKIEIKKFYRPDLLALISLIFFCFLSLIVNGYAHEWIFYLFKFRWILFLYLFSLFFRLSQRAAPVFLIGLMTSLYVSSLNAIFQHFTGLDVVRNKFIMYTASYNEHITRVTSFFNLPTTYGYSLSMALLVPLAFLFLRRPFKQKALMALVFFSGFGSLILTYTRGAWISFGCAFFCLFWFVRRKFILPVIPVLLVFGVVLFYSSAGFQERISSLLNTGYHSNSQRIELWVVNWEMFKDHPLFGVGLHKNDWMAKDYHEAMNHEHGFVSHAHNTYLQFLVGTGVFGFISFLAFFVIVLRKNFAHLRQRKNSILWATLLSVFLSFLVGCLFDCNMRDSEVSYMLISFLAILFFLSEDRSGTIENLGIYEGSIQTQKHNE